MKISAQASKHFLEPLKTIMETIFTPILNLKKGGLVVSCGMSNLYSG